VGPRVGLDDVEKRKFLPLQGLELRPLSLPAHIQSLYRLSYPGYLQVSNSIWIYNFKISSFCFKIKSFPKHEPSLDMAISVNYYSDVLKSIISQDRAYKFFPQKWACNLRFLTMGLNYNVQ
jgi:hypothetical protein